MTGVDVVLGPRRQLTLPSEACEALGIEVGDHLELAVADGVLTVRPRKTRALEALREIRRAFAVSGVTEEEIQEEGRRVREQLTHERYAAG